MAIRSRRTKFLFYVVSIVLPSLLLLVFTLRLVSQDRELARKRIAEDRQKYALETGRTLLSVLDKAKIRAGGAGYGQAVRPSDFSIDPLIALVCELRDTELRLPWEDTPESLRTREVLRERKFLANLDLIEKAEFTENNAVKAVRLGQAILKTDLNREQAAMIRLSLACSLYKAGHAEEAKEIDRFLLSLPADIQDEFQIPFALYAAERLANSESDHPAIFAALDPAAYPWGRLSPGAVFHGQDIFLKLAKSSVSAIREKASRALTAILDLSKNQEQAEFLKAEIPILGISAGQTEKEKAEGNTWTLFGQIPWFVSAADRSGDKDFLIACDARFALKNALDIIGEPAVSTIGTTIGGLQDQNGLPIGRAFPNAHIVLPPTLLIHSSSPSNSRATLYLLMVVIALGLAVFGSILFWRDVRRDLETAELRSQFVASVSHELNSPLAAIRMFAETLRLNRLREPEKKNEYLETIVNESQRLDRLIANVLDFSKIEKGRRIYRLEKTSIKEVLESAARTMDYPLRQKGFRLRLAIADDIPEINADRDALLQAVLNLLDNAMKYSGDAREIDLSLEEIESNVIIRIHDRGVGIPEAEQKRIFEKFHRVSDPRNEGIVGAGLGLALAAHIIEAHGGRIDVQSRPGEGSVFSVILPLESQA